MAPATVFIGLAFVFGAIIGSFLNVIALRFGSDRSALVGRSQCPKCHRTLLPLELVPVFSYLFLQGRCRTCHSYISVRYPLVELATALGTASIAASTHGWATVLLLVLFWTSLVIALVDLEQMLIPDQAVIVIALVGLGFQLVVHGGADRIWEIVLGGVIGGGLPGFLVLVTRGRGMGLGDVKLGAAIGVVVGYPLIGVALFLAVTSGAVVGLSLILLQIRALRDALPFGPFLLLGGFLAMLWGERILAWYLGLSRIG